MGVRSGSRAACGSTKGAVPRAPNHAFGFPKEAKMVQKGGPGAFQQQMGCGEVQEAFQDPKLSKPSFWEPFRVQNETQKQGVLSEAFWAAFGSK